MTSSSSPHLLYQRLEAELDLESETLRARTVLWLVVHVDFSEEDVEATWPLHLHCRQVTVDAVTCGGDKCLFSHLDPLTRLCPPSSSSITPTFDAEELDVRFRAGLEVTAEGELLIQVPRSAIHATTPQSMSQLQPLPRRVAKEVSEQFERLSGLQDDFSIPTSSPHRPSALGKSTLLQLTIDYHISGVPFQEWAGWTWAYEEHGEASDRNDRIVLHGLTNHGACDTSLRSSMVDGVRCWMPCLDPPVEDHHKDGIDGIDGFELARAVAVFDINITLLPPKDSAVLYRVLSSGVLVYSSKIHHNDNAAPITTTVESSRVGYTYRFITPDRMPLYSLGIFVGALMETYSVPFYGCQGQIWLASNTINKSTSSGNRTSIHKFAAQVKHTFQGFDLALRYLHKSISRRYTYARCTVIFVPDLECDFVAFDGFLLLSSAWLHDESAIFMEMPTHLLLLRAYLYSWLKSAFLLASYDAEYLLHGAVGFMLDVYVEHIFGVEESRYRFLKQMESVVAYEKYSLSAPLTLGHFYPVEYRNFMPQFGRYLCYKSVTLMHMLCHHTGGSAGGVEVVLRCFHNATRAKALQTTKNNSAAMLPPSSTKSQPFSSMPPPTPYSGVGGVTPYYGAPTTPHSTPGMSYGVSSIPNTPHLTPMVSPWTGTGAESNVSGVTKKERGGSVDLGVVPADKEIYASWKFNPAEKESYNKEQYEEELPHVETDTAQSNATSENNGTLPTLERQWSISSTASSMEGDITSEGTDTALRKKLKQRGALDNFLWGSIGADESFPDSIAHASVITGSVFLRCLRSLCIGAAGSGLDESFLEKWVGRPGCLFLRAIVSIDAKNKKVAIVIDQPGFCRGQINPRYAYKDKININVVEDKEWQYSRRIDGQRHQSHSYSLHHKSRRGGGRKRLANDNDEVSKAEKNLPGAIAGNNPLTQLHFQDLISPKRIGKDGQQDVEGGCVQAMALPVMKRKDADIAAALTAGFTGGGIKVLGQLVQFVAIDPDILWTREIRQYMPDSLLIEQLYSQLDLLGQIQAMRSLSLDRRSLGGPKAEKEEGTIDCGGETLPEQRLRLRALADILVNAQNEVHVCHSLLARCEAAYAVAQWQILHAPLTDPSSSVESLLENSNCDGTTSWIGMDILVACIRNMFMETTSTFEHVTRNDVNDVHASTQKIKVTSLLPLPNDFLNHDKSYLRDALLQAVASIKAKNGQTPLKIVELLLTFAEKNDNVSCPTAANKSESEDKMEQGSFNDGHYCSLLLLCLSQVQLAVVENPALPPHDQKEHLLKQKNTVISLLERIVSVATYLLKRERIMLACLADDGSTEVEHKSPAVNTCIIRKSGHINAVRDARMGLFDRNSFKDYFYDECSENQGNNNGSEDEEFPSKLKKAKSQTAQEGPGGGMLTSTALQCICHTEIQLSRILSNNPDEKQCNGMLEVLSGSSRKSQVDAYIKAISINTPFQFSYDPYRSDKRRPSQVRCSAVDALIRIGFAKFIAASRFFKFRRQLRQKGGGDSQRSEEEFVSLEMEVMDSLLLASLRIAIDTIATDPSRKVRRAAAVSLLHSLQDVESPIAYNSVSLSEQLNTFNWHDPSGLVVTPPALITNVNATTSPSSQLSANGNRRYHEEYRNHLSRISTNKEMANTLKKWWDLMDSGSMCRHDQMLRTLLWSAWSFVFFQDAATTRISANHNIPKSLLYDADGKERDVDDINIYLEDLRDMCFPVNSSVDPSFADVNVLSGLKQQATHQQNSILNPDRLRIVDPIDSVCVAEWGLRGGGMNMSDPVERSFEEPGYQRKAADQPVLPQSSAVGGGSGSGLNVLRLSRRSSVAELPGGGAPRDVSHANLGTILEKRSVPEENITAEQPKKLKLKITMKM